MKTLIVALVFFLLGFGAFWGYNKYLGVMKENDKLRQMVKEVPSTSIEPSPTLEPGLEPEKVQTGSIEGTLGYPSEGIPPLEVIAFSMTNPGTYFKVETEENQGTYIIENLPEGNYKIVAYPKGGEATFSGGYTKAVPCGLSVVCTDHSLIAVVVKAGEVTKGADPKDWYAPENSFPSKPQE